MFFPSVIDIDQDWKPRVQQRPSRTFDKRAAIKSKSTHDSHSTSDFDALISQITKETPATNLLQLQKERAFLKNAMASTPLVFDWGVEESYGIPASKNVMLEDHIQEQLKSWKMERQKMLEKVKLREHRMRKSWGVIPSYLRKQQLPPLKDPSEIKLVRSGKSSASLKNKTEESKSKGLIIKESDIEYYQKLIEMNDLSAPLLTQDDAESEDVLTKKERGKQGPEEKITSDADRNPVTKNVSPKSKISPLEVQKKVLSVPRKDQSGSKVKKSISPAGFGKTRDLEKSRAKSLDKVVVPKRDNSVAKKRSPKLKQMRPVTKKGSRKSPVSITQSLTKNTYSEISGSVNLQQYEDAGDEEREILVTEPNEDDGTVAEKDSITNVVSIQDVRGSKEDEESEEQIEKESKESENSDTISADIGPKRHCLTCQQMNEVKELRESYKKAQAIAAKTIRSLRTDSKYSGRPISHELQVRAVLEYEPRLKSSTLSEAIDEMEKIVPPKTNKRVENMTVAKIEEQADRLIAQQRVQILETDENEFKNLLLSGKALKSSESGLRFIFKDGERFSKCLEPVTPLPVTDFNKLTPREKGRLRWTNPPQRDRDDLVPGGYVGFMNTNTEENIEESEQWLQHKDVFNLKEIQRIEEKETEDKMDSGEVKQELPFFPSSIQEMYDNLGNRIFIADTWRRQWKLNPTLPDLSEGDATENILLQHLASSEYTERLTGIALLVQLVADLRAPGRRIHEKERPLVRLYKAVIRSDKVIKHLLSFLEDKSKYVRRAAAITLICLFKSNEAVIRELNDAVQDTDPIDRSAAALCLALEGSFSAPILNAVVEQWTKVWRKLDMAGVLLALRQLSSESPVVVSAVAEYLNSRSWTERLKVCKTLPFLKSQSTVDVSRRLVSVMEDDWHPSVRTEAARVLGVMGLGEMVYRRAASLLGSNEDLQVLEGLRIASTLEVLTPLIMEKLPTCLRCKNYSVRLETLRLVLKLGTESPELLRIISEMTLDTSSEIRKEALTFIGAKDKIILLASLKHDHDSKVRMAALARINELNISGPELKDAIAEAYKRENQKKQKEILSEAYIKEGGKISELDKPLQALVSQVVGNLQSQRAVTEDVLQQSISESDIQAKYGFLSEVKKEKEQRKRKPNLYSLKQTK